MRALVIVLLLGAAAAGGYLVARARPTAGDTSSSPPVIIAPVEHRTLRETLDVRGRVVEAGRSELRAEGRGRVTRVGLRRDRVVRPGDAVVDVDGRPQVVVAGRFPYWRDLSSGSRGRDVRQLQRLLERIGLYQDEVDGVFGPATGAALRAWQDEHGYPVDGVLRQGDLIVADVPARVGAVRVAVGDRLGVGDVLAVLTNGAQLVEVELDAAERPRVEVGQRAVVELSGTSRRFTGRVDRIAHVPVRRSGGEAATVFFPTHIVVDEPLDGLVGAPVAVEIVTAEAPDARAVPLAAVGMDADGHAMVQVRDGDGVRPVRIETGIVEGGHIEARGLDGVESVVVQTP